MAATPISTGRHRAEASLDLRVEDYLDDKLQSTTDLDTLPSLLAGVELQRSQLRAQLDFATRELEAARLHSHDRRRALAAQIDAFRDLQCSIDRRLRDVSESDAPADAVARLQGPLARMRSVELAVAYLGMLRDVEAWREEARSHLPASPGAALESYTKLRSLAAHLHELREPADGAAVHLVHRVDGVASALWEDMRRTMAAEMEGILHARKWPSGIDPDTQMDDEWMACFERLLDLQAPTIRHAAPGAVVVLLPFDVMSRIFASEFRYHFLSTKKTSSSHALGTHCLPWWLSTVDKWGAFFRDNVGPLLADRFRDAPAAGSLAYTDPACALIASMLPVLQEKVSTVLAEARKSSGFLSSFVRELLGFDETVRTRFGYDGGDPVAGWPGLAGGVLRECFEQWFAAEKEFALERYRSITAAADARNIDYDYSANGRTKPTYGAVRITDLLRNMTGQYGQAREFKHKIRFLVGIQLEILDQYHDRLRGALEAYHSMTSAVGRTLHGASREQLAALGGTGGLESLCRVYGSADHVVNTLRDWSNEEFFVSLWEELRSRARNGAREEGIFASEFSYDEVKDRTSSAVGSDQDGGVLFDETMAAYSLRRDAARDFIVGALVDSHHKAFRSYVGRVQWTTIDDGNAHVDQSALPLTVELDEPLETLKRNIEFLTRALSTASLRRIFRPALEKIHDQLWSDVLMRHHFTPAGAAQFRRDVAAISALVERFLPGAAAAAMGALEEALVLLNLPLEGEEPAEDAYASDRPLTLRQVSDRVFTDNAEAKSVLEELGIIGLTPANARNILQRRVENNE